MNDLDLEAFKNGLACRRSVRGYLPTSVPQDVLNSVFELAQSAASNCNTQPWQVYVASADACERLREKFPASMAGGKFNMDFHYEAKYDGVYKERQYDAAAQLYSAMGVERSDREGRNEAFLNNFRFFGAPHVAFIFLPEAFGIRESADVGMYTQNLMLSMVAHGLACCPQTALSMNAKLVKDELNIDDSNKLLFGVSFGYEDVEHSANTCRVGRAPLEQSVHFINS